MTATTFGDARPGIAVERRLPLAPAEGWTTVGLVLLLCLTLAWSLDQPNWVAGPRGQTAFLPMVTVLGVAWGIVSAKAGWSRWLAHLLGATFAALILPIVVGSVLLHGQGDPGAWFQATAAAAVDSYLDLTYRGLRFTGQIGHFMLFLGALGWATGQFAAYAVFHHRRPLNGVIIVGLLLVANMSLTPIDQLVYLVVYSLAALFLLIRYHAFDERTLWLRHRIGDAGALGQLYLRGGTIFVAAAVVASLFLTAGARSTPLAQMWNGADAYLVDIGRELQRFLRASGASRIEAVDFGSTASITGTWTTDPTPVLRISLPADTPASEKFYWRAVAYDHFDGRSWSWTGETSSERPADAGLLSETRDNPLNLHARRTLTYSVHELAFSPRQVFAPDAPASLDVPATVSTVGSSPDTFFAGIEASASDYTVTAEVPLDGVAHPDTGLTGNKLKVAGTDYPAGIRQLYIDDLPASIVGPQTRALLAEILTQPRSSDSAYDRALAVKGYLLSGGGFQYNPDVSGIDCGTDSIVECFARHRQGYCEYYASTMVVLLRMQGVPARLAEGFLPGTRDAAGHETILKSQSHAWVEVYFPTYGWVAFDPTGSVGQDPTLPAGPLVTPIPVSPRPSAGGDNELDPGRTFRATADASGGATGGTTDGGPGSGPLVAVGILLAIAMGALAFVAWQRGPRTPPEPDSVYRGVVRLARRLGFAPRPSQTVFEYTAALGEVLPNARPDLQTVARAKVEVAYGRHSLEPSRMRSLRDAQRRLRVALLRLAFHRRERHDRRRRD